MLLIVFTFEYTCNAHGTQKRPCRFPTAYGPNQEGTGLQRDACLYG